MPLTLVIIRRMITKMARASFLRVLFLTLLCSTALGNYPFSVSIYAESELELFYVAQRAYDDRFYDTAVRYLNDFLKTYPRSSKKNEAKLLIGRCYFFQEKYLEAFEVFRGLLETSSLKDATLFWMGETYLKGQDYSNAQELYHQLINEYPDSPYVPTALHSLGWSYFEQDNYQESQKIFLEFVNRFKNHELYQESLFKAAESQYLSGLYEKAIETFRQFIIQFPKSVQAERAYFLMGECYYYHEDFPQAIEYYKKSMEISSDQNICLLSNVSAGWSFLKLNDFDNAQMHITKALDIAQVNNFPADDVLLAQATLHAKQNDHLRALSVYNQLITEYPQSSHIPEARLGKANELYLLNRFDEAIKQNRLIIKTVDDQPQAKNIVQKAYFSLGWIFLKQGEIEKAIASFQTIVDQAQSKSIKISALTQIGDAYHDTGKLSKALNIYDRILKEFPESLYTDYVQYRQGIVLLKMERTDSAAIVFQSLKNNYPDSRYLLETKYYLGLTYFKKENWQAVKEELQAFIDQAPHTHELQPDAHYLMGLAYFNLREVHEAKDNFELILMNYSHRKNLLKDVEINIAKCFYSLGNDKEALKRFKIIIYKYPQSEAALESLFWLGQYYFAQENWDQVITYLTQLIDQFPDSGSVDQARLYLGQAYEKKESFDLALNQYKQITDTTHREVFAKAQLAIANIFSRDIPHDQAVDIYLNIAQQCPEFMRDSFIKSADIYLQQDQHAKALNEYEKALKAAKGLSTIKEVEIYFLIADTYEIINENNKAIEAYLKIPYLFPDELHWTTKAYLRMARIFEDEEDWKNAKLVYEKIVNQQVDESKFAKERLEWIDQNSSLNQ